MASDQLEGRLAAVLAREIEGFEELVSCRRLSGGASQETYRLEIAGESGARLLAMRRAPGGEIVESVGQRPGLEIEAELMRVAGAAGVPEPEVMYVFESADGLGSGFVMEWLEGESLGPRIVRSPELAEVRPRLARQYGEAAARIHAIDLDANELRQSLPEMSPAEFVEQTWERYRSLDVPQPMIDYAGVWLEDHLPRDYEPALVHNDFRNGNVMVDQDGIVAVLDWEIAHVGDPMRDLGWICTNSWRFGSSLPVGGVGEYEDLFAGYEAVSGRPVDPDRVKFWEVFGSFWWACGCLGMAHHYRTGPDRSVERAAIGRRTSECQVDCVNLLIPGPVDLIEPDQEMPNLDMPRLDELVESVRDFLREDVMPATQGRTSFLARVAGNSLDIACRELALGERARANERQRLCQLLGEDGDLEALRWRLVRGLRDRTIPLHLPGLPEHLRATVVNQIAIDQPRYSGFKRAIGPGS